MSLFGSPHFLGVDFGTASIKVVELGVKKNRPVLINYGEIGLAILERDRLANQGNYDATVTVYLRSLLEYMRTKTRDMYVAMPAFVGLITLVEFPEMKESELQEAIRFEAHKYIPSPLEEVALSWDIVGERPGPTDPATGKSTKKMEVLLVAALHKEVERYESYIAAAGGTMQLLELETFSLVRSIIGSDPGIHLIVDIGSRATNLVLVENGLVKLSRNLDVGGRDITRTLTESLGVAADRADALKKSGKDFLIAPEAKILFPTLDTIGAEAKRIVRVFTEKHPDSRIDDIILSGGTAGFMGITEYYSQMLGLPVVLGNPWRHLDVDPHLIDATTRMGTSFSVALGLALQGAMGSIKK